MKKYFTLLIAIISPLYLSGFGLLKSKTPNCSDENTKSLLTEIIQEEISEATEFTNSFWNKNIQHSSIKIQDIITNNHNKDIDIYWCGANVEITPELSIVEQYIALRKQEMLEEYNSQFKKNRKALQEKIRLLDEEEQAIPHFYNSELAKSKEVIISKLNKLEDEISELQLNYDGRKNKAYNDFKKSKENYINSLGRELNKNEKQSFKNQENSIKEALQEHYDTYIKPKVRELNSLKEESAQLIEHFKQKQEKELQAITKKKQRILDEESRLKEKLNQDKQQIDIQLYQEKEKIQQGLSLPTEYKIQSFEDKDEFYIELL